MFGADGMRMREFGDRTDVTQHLGGVPGDHHGRITAGIHREVDLGNRGDRPHQVLFTPRAALGLGLLDAVADQDGRASGGRRAADEPLLAP